MSSITVHHKGRSRTVEVEPEQRLMFGPLTTLGLLVRNATEAIEEDDRKARARPPRPRCPGCGASGIYHWHWCKA